MKGKVSTNQTLMAVALLVVIASGSLYAGSQLGVFKPTAASITGQPTTVPTGSLQSCTGLTSIVLNSAVRNPLNSTIQYLAAPIRIVVAGQTVATDTTTAGASLAYKATNIPCTAENFVGDYYVIASATQNSVKGTYSIAGTSGTKIVDATPAANIALQWLEFNTGVNTSVSGTTSTQGTATALSAGQSANAKLLVIPPTTSFTQYGASELGVLIVVDTVNSAAYSDKAVALSSSDIPLTELTDGATKYAKESSVDSGNRFYLTRAISSNDAQSIINVKVANDGGASAGSSDDPVIYFEPLQYFEDNDGTIKVGAFNSGGNAVGLSHSTATFNVS